MEISLNKHEFLNQRTGETKAPSEFLANLRALEETLARCDDDIAVLKANLKTARELREKIIAQLRGAVRSGAVLPILELADATDRDDPDMAGQDEPR